MKSHWTGAGIQRRLLLSLPFVFAAGCAAPSDAPTSVPPARSSSITSVGDDLGRLRAAVAPFENIETAKQAGWSQLTGCMVDDQGQGGMGFHYAQSTAFDGVVDPVQPKALLYEPQSNGRLRLVAVEFIVPYSIAPRDGAPPRLFDQDFVHNDSFQIWMLHAWIFKNNPSGMFASWNPNVNCDAVPAAARMSHSH